MKLPESLDWKVRAAVDLTVAAVAFGLMYSQGAPPWALTLALYVATKPSRTSLAGDLAALQTTLRVESKAGGADQQRANAQMLSRFLEELKK